MRGRTVVSEWVGGRVLMPAYVMEGEPYRPELILWLELPADLVVGSQLLDPKKPAVHFGETLLAAMARPMAGSPRRPRRVRVATADQAAEVREVAGDVEVVVAPTPELDAVMSLMASRMPADEGGIGYLEEGRISTGAVEKLFRSAELLWQAAPWKLADDACVIRIDIPKLSVRGACVSIIGALGESFGFLLFPSLDGYDRFLAAAHRRKRGPIDLGTPFLSLNYERGADLPPAMRREVARHGWPVAAPDAYPDLQLRDRDGTQRPHTERDLLVAAAVATSLTSFCVKHSALFTDEEIVPVCESFFDEDDLEVRLTAPADAAELFEIHDVPPVASVRSGPKVGRNAPCPCGSGQKYKKCCLGKNEASAAPAPGERAHVHELDERLVLAIHAWAKSRHGKKLDAAEAAFKDAESAKQLARPWAVYHALVDGKTFAEQFVAAQPHLPGAQRDWIAAQRSVWLGIWEVIAVDPGRGFSARDLLSNEVREVHEISASKNAQVHDAVLGRMVTHEGLTVMCGAHPQPLGPREASEVVIQLRKNLKRKTAIPVERLRDEKVGRALIGCWEDAIEEMNARVLVLPNLQNTDGDELLLTTDHFAFAPGDRVALEQRLSQMAGVEPPIEGESNGIYTFLKAGNAKHKSQETTVIGRAVIERSALQIESNSVRRADALRRRIEKACSKLIRHRIREHSDPMVLAKQPARPGAGSASALPPAEAARLVREYKERHYADWIDQALPALSGKTPRAALRTKAGRTKLDLVLKEMEHQESQVEAAARFDFAQLRRALQLEP